MKSDVGFSPQANAGWDYAADTGDYSPPPKSSKLVAQVSWSWSPAHNRIAKYWLSTNRKRSAWFLYEEDADFDSGKPMFACVGVGEPYRGITAKHAAKELLLANWKYELKNSDTQEFSNPKVDKTGLLDRADITRIGVSVSAYAKLDCNEVSDE
jgi:hypothetical protein